MATVTIHRFTVYDAANDVLRTSRRWATKEGVAWANGHIIKGTAIAVDSSVLSRDIPGMTDIGFDPHRKPDDFPSQVRP